MGKKKIPENLSKEEQYKLADRILAGKPIEEKKPVTQEVFDSINHIPQHLIIAEKCKRNLFYFLKEFWSTYNTQDLVAAPWIEFVCNELQFKGRLVIDRKDKELDFILNCPPGTGKTSILLAYTAWLVANDPKLTILYAMYAHDIAEQKLGKVKTIIKSDKFRSYFPDTKIKSDDDKAHSFSFTENGRISCGSPKSQILSNHYFALILDDIQDANRANSRTERINLQYWLDNTLLSRKDDKKVSVLIFCQQRLRQGDITDYLLKKDKAYTHFVLPGEYNEKIIKPESARMLYKHLLLDPIRLSPIVLKDMQIDLGLGTFSSQVNQNPADKSAAIISEDSIPILTFKEWIELTEGKTLKFNAYCDTAFTKVTSNDPSSIIITTKIDERLFILNVSQVWLEFAELTRHIYKFCADNGLNELSKIHIEPKASGKDLISALNQYYNIPAVETPNPTGQKKERLASISGICQAKKVCLVEGNWNRLLLEEITSNENPRDDIQDAFYYAVQDNLVTGRKLGVVDFRVMQWNGTNREDKIRQRFQDYQN
jgi:phage terminase large subunit-like protein